MDLESEVLRMTAELYENISFTRSDVQLIISKMSSFIEKTYIPIIHNAITSAVTGAVEKEVLEGITRILNKYSNPFKNFQTESKRIKQYEKKNLYREPVISTISCNPVVKLVNEQRILKAEKIEIVHISLRDSLKSLLQTEGLFTATLKYLQHLKRQTGALENFVQGQLWQKMLKKSGKTSELVLPIHINSDGVEMGNTLGARAGQHLIDAVYATLPCFPPNFSSKLKSIFVTDLIINLQPRQKKYGGLVFQALIDDLKSLMTEGIEIVVEGKNTQYFFCPL